MAVKSFEDLLRKTDTFDDQLEGELNHKSRSSRFDLYSPKNIIVLKPIGELNRSYFVRLVLETSSIAISSFPYF